MAASNNNNNNNNKSGKNTSAAAKKTQAAMKDAAGLTKKKKSSTTAAKDVPTKVVKTAKERIASNKARAAANAAAKAAATPEDKECSGTLHKPTMAETAPTVTTPSAGKLVTPNTTGGNHVRMSEQASMAGNPFCYVPGTGMPMTPDATGVNHGFTEQLKMAAVGGATATTGSAPILMAAAGNASGTTGASATFQNVMSTQHAPAKPIPTLATGNLASGKSTGELKSDLAREFASTASPQALVSHKSGYQYTGDNQTRAFANAMRNSGSSEYSKEVSSFGNAGTPNFAPNALAYRVSNNEAQIAELGGKVEAHTRQFELVMNMNLKVEESITQVEQRVTTLHGATLQGLEANERDMELLKTNVEQTTTTLTELESKVGGEQQKLSAKLVELDQQLGSQKAVISVVQKSLTKLETDVGTKAGNEAFESFRKEQATQGENISKVREDITTLETGVNTKAGELESVQKLLGDRITRLEGDFNVANGKIQTLEGQITTKAESDHVNNEFSELKRKFADAETKKSDEISCLKEQLAEMAKSISSLTDTCTKITDQLENLASMSTEDNKHLKDLLAIVVQHPESVKRLTDYLVVAGSNGSLPQLPGILSRLTDDVNLRQKVDSILVVLTALGANANTLTQDLSELVHLQRAEREASIAFNHEFDNIAGGDAELPPRKKPKLAAEQDGTN